MKFEQYKEQFAFLREHGVATAEGLHTVRARTEETLASLMTTKPSDSDNDGRMGRAA